MRILLRTFIVPLIFMCLPWSLSAAQPVLQSIRFTPGDNVLHLEARLNQPAIVHIFRLQHPTRIVLDFDGVRMKASLKKTGLPLGGVYGMRYGYPQKGVLRLVLDVDKTIRFQHRSSIKSAELRLDLLPFAAHLPAAAAVSSTKNPAAKTAEPPRTMVVVIDPGHGGHDPGARGLAGTREKDIVLAIAKKLANEINQAPGMKAVLTRAGDYFVPLRGRLHRARKDRGDLFISIHADSWFDHDATGASAYTLSRHGATSEAARWLAGRENDSELAGVNLRELGDQSAVLRSVLIDLAQTATIQDSVHLGSAVLQPLGSVAGLHYRHVEQAPFMVLKSPDIPSVLIETGFLSNVKEELRLRDPAYQTALARAIFSGVSAYLKKYPPARV